MAVATSMKLRSNQAANLWVSGSSLDAMMRCIESLLSRCKPPPPPPLHLLSAEAVPLSCQHGASVAYLAAKLVERSRDGVNLH